MKDSVLGLTLCALLVIAGNMAVSAKTTTTWRELPQPTFAQERIQGTAGDVTHAEVIQYNNKLYTIVTYLPNGTRDPLSDQRVAFCGAIDRFFELKSNAVVMIFSSVMHHRDCYDLYQVVEIPTAAVPTLEPAKE